MYLRDQLQFVKCFRIPIGICLKASFQFVFRLIFGYVSSFFFKLLIFCIAFRLYFCKLQYFLSQNIIINFYYFFIGKYYIYHFCLYFYIFGCSIISCNYKTTKIFGGCVCVCVWFIFIHTFFFMGFLTYFSSILINKQSSLKGSLF